MNTTNDTEINHETPNYEILPMKEQILENKEFQNKPGPGRPRGSLNARTQDLFEITEKLECNPFEILIMFAKGDAEGLGLSEISSDLRLRAAKDACDYLFPKRKAIEHSAISAEDPITRILRDINETRKSSGERLLE